MDEQRRKKLQAELDSLPPEKLKGLQETAIAIIEELQSKVKPIADEIEQLVLSDVMQRVVQAAQETQKALQVLGVSSGTIVGAAEILPPEARGAFIPILNLAREHLEAGLLLKDYAEAINPDLTVKQDFLFKGELEQVLAEAAEDIAEYNKQIEAELAEAKEERIEKYRKTKQAKEKALTVGAIMTINNHLLTPSAADIAQLFTPRNVFKLKDFASRAGDIDELGQLPEAEEALEPLDEIHTAFMMFIFQMAYNSYDPASPEKPDDNITFYIPTIIKQLGLDARKGYSTNRSKDSLKKQRRDRLVELLQPFEEKLGRLPNGKVYQICVISSYDVDTELLTLHVPYFYRLVEYIAQKKYKNPAVNRLFHSTIANEPNTAAVELAARILAGVKQRGLHKDPINTDKGDLLTRTTKTRGKTKTIVEVYAPNELTPEEKSKQRRITYPIRWRSLFKECPQLEAKLDAVMASDKANKAMYFNKIIKDTVTAAIRIIMEKSDAPQYYLDFRIEPRNAKGEIATPTKSTLNEYLIVSHLGKNKAFDLD